MNDGWTKRSRTLTGGGVELWLERPLPGYPPEAGAVEQWFSGEAVALFDRSSRSTTLRSTAVRPRRSAAPTSRRPRVVVTDAARADIRRELASWDGREIGGALVGKHDGDTVIVERAGGLGVGVTAQRGDSWVRLRPVHLHDFALAHRLELVGDWHSHRQSAQQSSADERAWEGVRNAIGAPAYIGLVASPRRAVAIGLSPGLDEEVWAWTGADLGVYLVTADGCSAVPPPT